MQAVTGEGDGDAAASMGLDVLTICGTYAALTAAHTTGLLKLAMGQLLAPVQYAQSLGLEERTTATVLQVLAAAGLLERHGELYGVPAQTPTATGVSLAWLPMLQEHFAHTLVALRTGRTLDWLDSSVGQRESSYRDLVAGLGTAYAKAAEALAAHIDGQPERILDVGCGSGVWSLAIAARHPAAHVTGLDLPAVLDAFVARARQNELHQRIAPLAGDMHSVALPAEHFDLIVIANVLRLEAPERAAQLVARLAGALRRGGRLLIVDALAGGTPLKELVRAAYALHLSLRTGHGRVHSAAQIAAWTAAAGLTDTAEIDCGSQMTAIGALLSRKP
ncbi:MAG TPA: class I SAM-dependent methyltransferase [Pseudomonadota bacterium]|nr:class I SAM-dependent methyltransferase [Pseudomonadota bacterium]